MSKMVKIWCASYGILHTHNCLLMIKLHCLKSRQKFFNYLWCWTQLCEGKVHSCPFIAAKLKMYLVLLRASTWCVVDPKEEKFANFEVSSFISLWVSIKWNEHKMELSRNGTTRKWNEQEMEWAENQVSIKWN